MSLLREARQAKNKAKRLGKRAGGSDGTVIFIGVGMAAVAGLVWYGVSQSKSSSTTSNSSPTNPNPWRETTGGIPAGFQFAIVISNPDSASIAQLTSTFQNFPGSSISLPGQPPPTGWPVSDSGGTNAFRAMGINTTGATIPFQPVVQVWTKAP